MTAYLVAVAGEYKFISKIIKETNYSMMLVYYV
jgi:hypothetical protein